MPIMRSPGAAYMLEAMAITRELAEQGIDLTPEQARDLAHARLGPPTYWLDQEPKLSPELDQALDRMLAAREHDVSNAQNMAPDQGRDRGQGSPTPTPAMDQAPDQQERGPSVTGNRIARDLSVESDNRHDPGHGDHVADQVTGDHVRNFLDELFDRDEES